MISSWHNFSERLAAMGSWCSLVNTSHCHCEDRGFESLRARHVVRERRDLPLMVVGHKVSLRRKNISLTEVFLFEKLWERFPFCAIAHEYFSAVNDD